MQQPKVFYPQHETYASRPLERADGQQQNRGFPAFVLPENLASVGTPSLYHPPSQDLCAAPPAGFHMAPCGCFFDPRIYRIEWATANFVQPSVYKLSGGPNPPNSYLLDSQKYLKGSVQPLPYAPAYQPVAGHPPFAMPFFKPEGSPAKLTDHVGFVANLAHGPPFVEVPHLPGESLMPVEEHKLLAVVPSSSLKEQQQQQQQHHSQVGPYQPLDPRAGLAYPVFKGFPAEEVDFKVSEVPLGMGEPLLSPIAHPEEAVACGGMEQLEPCVNLEGILPRETPLLEEPGEAFQLLDQVPLEDAMKLFDCSPIHSDIEAPLDEMGTGGQAALPGEAAMREGCFSGEDSSSDIRSLNLPDELLSFDYSVPEILSAVTSLDYLYDVNSFGEGPPWESRLGSPPPLPRLLRSPAGLEEKRRNLGPGNRARKPERASMQGGNRETLEGNAALLAL
ncbi:proline-rich protein 22 [Thamnophis elegans]|uniref:proline-rich protein 22 n=1 Tax=Thamnophis elegans TaxID=35005 RepID=UPI0013770B83|nr:proline-rich protein 22 [Thamnophis elegans]